MPTTSGASIEREMRELEERYWQAMKERDVAVAQRATADPCLVAGASGVATVDAETFTRMMEGASWRLRGFELENVQVQALTDDVRVVGYTIHEDLTVDGEPVKLDAADSSVWVLKGGAWVCAVHTESVLGDAYGRDRGG